jgi:hypothetical protein
MKYLFLILLIPSLIFGAGTEYHPDSLNWTSPTRNLSPFDSLESTFWLQGFNRISKRIGQTSTGDVIVATRNFDATLGAICVTYTSDWGTSFGYNRNVLNASVIVGMAIQCYGDSCFLAAERAGEYPIEIAKYSGSTLGFPSGSTHDTLPLIVLGTTNKSALGVNNITTDLVGFSYYLYGSQIMTFDGRETGSPDSADIQLSTGQVADTTTWIDYDTAGYYGAQNGLRVPFEWSGGCYGGMLMFEKSTNDVRFYDPTGSYNFDTLDLNLISYRDDNFQTYGIAQWKDSFGLYFHQLNMGGELRLTLFRIDNVTADNNTGVIVGIDTVIVLDSAYMPPTSACLAQVSIVYNNSGVTDTGYIFYRYWAREAETDSFDVCYKMFVLNATTGITLGSQVIMKAAVGVEGAAKSVDTCMVNLQAPYKIYNIGGEHLLSIAYTDSVGAGADLQKLYILLDKNIVGSPANSSGKRRRVAIDYMNGLSNIEPMEANEIYEKTIFTSTGCDTLCANDQSGAIAGNISECIYGISTRRFYFCPVRLH